MEKNDEWKKEIEAVGIMAEKLGFSFCLCHGPSGQFYNGEEERQNLILTTKRAIEACAMLGIKDIVVHSVTYPEITPTQFKKENKKFNEMFFDDMEKHGVNVLIENSTRKNSRDYYLRFGMEMKEYIEFVGHPMLYACWDTGHAHMEGVDQYESIVTLGNLLRGLHIADNLGMPTAIPLLLVPAISMPSCKDCWIFNMPVSLIMNAKMLYFPKILGS